MEDKELKDWENRLKAVRLENKLLINGFENWLKENNLKPKTVNLHVSNIDFYINTFLLYYDIIKAADGATCIDSFLGDFFIRKTSWGSEYTIKENVTSLKKFYHYMVQSELTNKEDLAFMKEIIKEGCDYWIKEMKRYRNKK